VAIGNQIRENLSVLGMLLVILLEQGDGSHSNSPQLDRWGEGLSGISSSIISVFVREGIG
jgi:hypothetical protein